MTRTDPEAPLVLLPETGAAVPARLLWAANRFRMETENRKSRRYGGKGPHHWYALLFLMRALKVLLKVTRQYETGVRNAWDIAVREIDVAGRSARRKRGERPAPLARRSPASRGRRGREPLTIGAALAEECRGRGAPPPGRRPGGRYRSQPRPTQKARPGPGKPM